MSSAAEREAIREFAARWEHAGPVLEALKRRELRAYDFDRNSGAIASLFQLGTDRREIRKTSGLVEWYRRLGLGR